MLLTRVLVIANNLLQASYRVRVEALLPLLQRRGIDAEVGLRTSNILANRRMYQSAAGFDAVLLQRKFLDPWEARTLRRHAKRILYDIDDALMYQNRPVSAFSRWRTNRRFQATARAVDHVVAGNQYLADHFSRLGRQTTILPTVVDPGHYVVKQHVVAAAPKLVWIGSRSTLSYLRQAMPAIALAAKRVAGLSLLTIADETIDNAPVIVSHTPWSAATEAQSLAAGDIGIAPTPSDPWTLGKCGFKIVQYMAAGLPVIASPVGANAELVREGETGFLPRTDEQWASAIVQLAGDVALRQRLGHAGRECVERELCLERAADVWAKLLDER